jgi:putrescine:ornithine antiporter
VNRFGAPITGMIVVGVVQSLMALSTISPNLSEQFGALVNLAVVTNVLPYVMALSGLMIMMRKAGSPAAAYRRNVAVALVAMLYSTYAIYASGLDAVLGGMLVTAAGYVIYGFIAHRFAAPAGGRAPAARGAAASAVAIVLLVLGFAASAHGQTLDRVRDAGKLRIGYREDARPFSYRDESGRPTGYSIALCEKVAEAVKAEVGSTALATEYVAVTSEDRFRAVREGRIDLLCAEATMTLERRREVAFSIPVFPSGIGALLRADAPVRLRDALEGRHVPYRPLWRASVQVLDRRVLSAISGTTAETWLAERKATLKVLAELASVDGYETGIQRVLSRKSDVFFADRPILLDAAKRSPSSGDLRVLDRMFTYEPLALALPRGDEDFRLLVDRALSGLYRSDGFGDLYTSWFGEPDENALTFFRLITPPE